MNLQEAANRSATLLSRRSRHRLTEALFLRLLGLIYIASFASFWPQITGLIGSHGIVPAARLMEAMRGSMGTAVYRQVPSLFWFFLSDRALVALCAAGCFAGLCLLIGLFSRLAGMACFLLYLSIVTIGAPFTNFQWDALLLEAGFLAIFSGAGWLVWGYRLLLFRLMFESVWVKIASRDPNWRNLHALRFHFMTQPLPNPVAYYAYRLPPWILDGMTAVTLAIEFIAPIMLWLPRKVRQTGVALLVFLQVAILLTGNYAFFNWLAIALCLWGMDDRTFSRVAHVLRRPLFQMRLPLKTFRPLRGLGNLCVAVLIALGAIQLLTTLDSAVPAPLTSALAIVSPLEIVNSYGLFAVMTTTRPEIVIEGSDDQTNWREYSFPYKPGNTHRGLPWVAPYQPRLDWQMWFAALGSYEGNTWTGGLIYRLLTGEPETLKLLNPVPFSKPPHYIRALLYRYNFSMPSERRQTGAVWNRQLEGVWFGPVALKQ